MGDGEAPRFPPSPPLPHSRETDEMVIVMVATLTRPTAACPITEEEQSAEDGVGGVGGRELGGGSAGR